MIKNCCSRVVNFNLISYHSFLVPVILRHMSWQESPKVMAMTHALEEWNCLCWTPNSCWFALDLAWRNSNLAAVVVVGVVEDEFPQLHQILDEPFLAPKQRPTTYRQCSGEFSHRKSERVNFFKLPAAASPTLHWSDSPKLFPWCEMNIMVWWLSRIFNTIPCWVWFRVSPAATALRTAPNPSLRKRLSLQATLGRASVN